MGGILAKLFGSAPLNTLMLGLDAAGMSTILYKLNLGEIEMIPSEFMVENVKTKKEEFHVWDLGGRFKMNALTTRYYRKKNSIIWVIDSNDHERVNDSKDELFRFLSEDELKIAILLVFANKQDLPSKMSVKEVTDKLGLNSIRNRKWHIQGCCAITGEGLLDGLKWLSDTLNTKNQQ